MIKIYAQGNYLTIEQPPSPNNKIEDHAKLHNPKKEIEFKRINDTDRFLYKSDEYIKEYKFSDLAQADGTPFASISAFEAFIYENTGNYGSASAPPPPFTGLTDTELRANPINVKVQEPLNVITPPFTGLTDAELRANPLKVIQDDRKPFFKAYPQDFTYEDTRIKTQKITLPNETVTKTFVYGYAPLQSLGQTIRQWIGIAISPSGDVYAVCYPGDIYKQTDGIGDFVALNQTIRQWIGIAISPSGDVYAVVYNGDIYKQTDGIGDFVALNQTVREWHGIAISPSGDVYAVVFGGDIYKQTDGIGDFVALNQTIRQWASIAISPSGDVYAVVYNGDIYKQTDGIGNFVALNQTVREWVGIAISPSGDVYAAVNNGDIYKQTAGLGAFKPLGQTPRIYTGITFDSSGKMIVCVYNGDIYEDTNNGEKYLQQITIS